MIANNVNPLPQMYNTMQFRPEMPNFIGQPQALPQSSYMVGKQYPTLYVGNLEEQITEEMLYKTFLQFGHIFSIKVMRDRNFKTSRGFAYVSFYQQREAENARVHANHIKILQQELRVTWKKDLKTINPEANVIVKNLDESVTGRELEEAFKQFGNIFSSIVCYDTNGKSRGYGYVQFDTVESAQKSIAGALDLKIQEKVVDVQVFKKKVDRIDSRKNLYFKNLPNSETHSKEQVKELLDKLCQQFGEIESSCVEVNGQTKKYFAFVSFKEKDSAEKCLASLKDSEELVSATNPDKLYVEWHQSKLDRQKTLKQFYSNTVNETNLYTKFLKKTVTTEDLKKVYEKYGVITSCIVKTPQVREGETREPTNFGYINFADKEQATRALQDAQHNQEVKELYETKKFYLTFFINKNKFLQFKEARNRYKQPHQQQVQFIDPSMFPFMFQQFPFMYGGPKQFNGNNTFRPPFQGQQFVGMPMMPNQQFIGNTQQGQQQKQQGQKQYNNYRYPNNQHQQKNRPAQGNKPGVRQQYNNNRGVGGVQLGNRQGNQQQQRPNQALAQNTVANPSYTSDNLKNRLNEFLNLEREKQRTILGELLYPKVAQFTQQTDLVPKITGMLIDFEVFEIQEIVELLDNDESLKERIDEAVGLIKEEQETN